MFIATACTICCVAENVTLVFGKDLDPGISRSVTILNPDGTKTTVSPSPEDGYSYVVEIGSKVSFSVVPPEGNVTYTWKVQNPDETYPSRVPKTYDQNEYTVESVKGDMELIAVVTPLTPVKFNIIPPEGSTGKKVFIEDANDDYGPEIKPESDGITYMLPKDNGVYFNAGTKEGYYVLRWLMNGVELAFSSYLDEKYVQNVSEGLVLEVYPVKEGTKYKVTYKESETAHLKVTDKSNNNALVTSGESIPAGNNIFFDLSLKDNDHVHARVRYWMINGKKYMDELGEPFTESDLEIKLVGPLDIICVAINDPDPESSKIVEGQNPISVKIDGSHVVITGLSGHYAYLYNEAGEMADRCIIRNGTASFELSSSHHSGYVLRSDNEVVKFMTR